MKEVFLLRHGEAQEIDYETDYLRKLTERGKLRSSIMADHLLTAKNRIDLILTSGAARARSTAEIVQNIYNKPDKSVIVDDIIYNSGDPWLLMPLIWESSDDVSSIMLVGHNPVLSELAFTLTGKFRNILDNNSVVKIKFDTKKWDAVESAVGSIEFYKYFSKGEIVDGKL